MYVSLITDRCCTFFPWHVGKCLLWVSFWDKNTGNIPHHILYHTNLQHLPIEIKGKGFLALSSGLSPVDKESQVQHAARWRQFNSDIRIAQKAASAPTLYWHKQNPLSSDNPFHSLLSCRRISSPLQWMDSYCTKSFPPHNSQMTFSHNWSLLVWVSSLTGVHGWLTARSFDDIITTPTRLLRCYKDRPP